jgi:uncharacterized protein
MGHEFEVPGSDLDVGGKSKDFVVRAAWVRGILEGTDATTDGKEGSLNMRLSKSGTDVVASGDLKVGLSMECARCTEPVALTIANHVSALFVPAVKISGGKPGKGGKDAKSDEDEYEFTSDEADTLPYDGDTVVLDDLVRDEILLEIPMIPLCKEDCPGIAHSPQGSTDSPGERPVDPRFAALKDFVLKPSTDTKTSGSNKPSKKPSK